MVIIIGAVYLSHLLNVTPTLEVLNIRDNDIGNEGIAAISEALQHNKSLITLEIGRCKLSKKGT